MNNIEEVRRLSAPAPRPQALGADGGILWMGSIVTDRLYAIDIAQWTVREEATAPGKPWGLAVVGDELRVILGETSDDHRVVRRFVPGHGFKATGSFSCPDDTGSHLSFDGDRLYVSQWYNRKLISVDPEAGVPGTVIDVPHGICGQVVVAGRFFLVTTDDESDGDYWLTRVDARGGTPAIDDIARIPFHARALAWDGQRFWTNHRERDEIVAFAPPPNAFA